jgi:RimJ/RimL family protein N-acetyltransferase
MATSLNLPGPAYRIVTPQLVIRCYSPADAQMLQTALAESVEHLIPWMEWAIAEPRPLQANIERLRQFRAEFDLGKNYTYGIFSPQENRLIGGTGLHPRVGSKAFEIGYWIHKDFINHGYATETAAALTKVGFEVEKVERMEIHCSVENIRSAAVPRKLGYQHEATLQKRSFAHGQKSDQMIWSLFREQYFASPTAKLEIAAYDAAGRRIL